MYFQQWRKTSPDLEAFSKECAQDNPGNGIEDLLYYFLGTLRIYIVRALCSEKFANT
jgi:hypothetical protein